METAISTDNSDFRSLRGDKYCLLVTFRRTGAAVNTPVWFGLSGDKLYVKTESPSGKVKRIRNNPRARVAACDFRGRPRGPAIEARARILPPGRAETLAECALRRHYGLGRRLFYLLLGPVFRFHGRVPVYLEVVPALPRESHGLEREQEGSVDVAE